MAHAQKADFVFRRNGRVRLNRPEGVSSDDYRQLRCNAGYAMFRGSVRGTGYPLHSPASPSLSLLCVTVCHHTSTGVYHLDAFQFSTTTFLKMKLHKASQKFQISVDLRKTNSVWKKDHHSALRPYTSCNVLMTQTHVHSDRILRLLKTNAVLKLWLPACGTRQLDKTYSELWTVIP